MSEAMNRQFKSSWLAPIDQMAREIRFIKPNHMMPSVHKHQILCANFPKRNCLARL